MGATYTRQSSYTDGDVITAAHTNDEFNQLLAAFASSSGHTHAGTSAEGGPITKLLGNTLTFGAGTTGTDITITFDGETSDGVLKWMEDEDYFEFSDDILVASTEKLQFRDTAIFINSSTDGQLDLIADGAVLIDTAGDITLDADGGDVVLKDGGTQYGSLTNTSGNLIIKSGSTTAVTFSGANTTFAGTVTIGSAEISETELEILDGANVTTAELNLLDGSAKSTRSITLQDADAFIVIDGTTTKQIPASDLSAYVTAEGTMSNWVLEDDDGTEVTITNTKEIKLIGSGITTNWTDTSDGSDADPYDMTFTVDAAQTGITSIYATDLIMGEDSQTAIDFGTPNEIDFKADNAARLTLTASALYPVTDDQIDLGTASLEFKDAFFDGTVTSDAFAGPLTGDVTGTADVATVATTVTITDNESTNENNAIIFTAGGDLDGGNLGLESDGDLHYNPSTGLLSTTGVTASGTVTFGSLSDGSVTVTAWVDEDNMASDSATLIPTQQSVKAYVDSSTASGTTAGFAVAMAIAL